MADEHAELDALVKAGARRYAAPAELGNSIRAALAGAEPSGNGRRWPAWLGLGAAFACGLLASVLVARFLPQDQGGLAQEVVAAHVRSLMVAHLEDVASTDQHTVKPWFAGKLDFSPPVNDLSAQGYVLTGGRLDYIDRHTAAALVYRHQRHAINVFVWPDRGAARSAGTTQDGFNLVAWNRGGMQFWAVSDLNAAELRQFAGLRQRDPAP